MRPLALALLVAAPALAEAPADPCAAARAAIPEKAAAAAAVAHARAVLDAYRASWRAACDPSRGPADVAALLSEADALVADVRSGRAVAALARELPEGSAWPVPAVRRGEDGPEVDWPAFAAFAARGTAEDARFFRGLARVTGPDGEPAWLGPAPVPGGAPCLRLAETSWSDVAQGLAEMERSRSDLYARRAARLQERLLASLDDLARGIPVCGCVRGDPLPALDALAATHERLGTPGRRALLASARGAADAVRHGTVRVAWLRDAPDAPATGCGAAP
jgi:hypothetical protein